jgi:type VI secretion system secreted protein Hcp
MAIDYFLRIDGIPGESDDAKHKGEIEVEAWSWGEASPLSAGGGGGRVQMHDLHFSARFSKASAALLLACASGRHLKSAVLTARRSGEKQGDFLVVSLSEVLVSSYQTGGNEDQDSPSDSVSLNFSEIQVEYRQQGPSGKFATSAKAGWDVRQGKPF